MGILEIIIFLASITNLVLGLFVFLKGPSKKINRLFGICSFITSIWIFTNLMMGFQHSLLWLKSTYAFGSLVPISALLMILELCNKKITKPKTILLFVLGTFFFIISYLNEFIVANVRRVYLGGFEGEKGPLFVFYSIYMFGIAAFIVYNLILRYSKTRGISRTQISYVLLGAILYISTVLIVSFIFPLFGIFKFVALDSPSSLFFVFFTTLAITRHHLFGIRVILAEILVGIMGLIWLIYIFLMPIKLLTISTFFLFLIFAYYLIKAIHEESRRREEAEKLAIQEKALREKAEKIAHQEVQMREKESQMREKAEKIAERERQLKVEIGKLALEQKKLAETQREIAQERQRKIERIYHQFTQKELEMIELKKKIAELETKLREKNKTLPDSKF